MVVAFGHLNPAWSMCEGVGTIILSETKANSPVPSCSEYLVNAGIPWSLFHQAIPLFQCFPYQLPSLQVAEYRQRETHNLQPIYNLTVVSDNKLRSQWKAKGEHDQDSLNVSQNELWSSKFSPNLAIYK